MTEADDLAQRHGVTRDDIEACADEAVLAGWFAAYGETIEELKAFVEGFRFTGSADPDWLRRSGGKLGYLTLTRRRIERRMLTLGFTPPWSPRDPRSVLIRRLEGEVARLRRLLEAGDSAVGEDADG
ncbi:MAG: hypothetical protein FP826_01565 [Sphingomonadales bacterium]|nr:hypothetical protein [Sphingomonadales bacterium]MBU3993751.1 hypothetical protein [Alphaproteobacteria bacterium]